MPRSPKLARISVLVTRPHHQAENLCQLIESYGLVAVRCPSVSIEAPSDPKALIEKLRAIDVADIVIFLSRNAVDRGINALRRTGVSLPLSAKVLAIGPGTADALQKRGIAIAAIPRPPFNTEAMLQVSELISPKGRSIFIFQGEGGRTWLSEKLVKDGATVSLAHCYRRAIPLAIDPKVITYWEDCGIDLITLTSISAAENLWFLLRHRATQFLQNAPIITASSRIKEGCRAIGYQGNIEITDDASQSALLKAIRTHKPITR